DPWTFSKGVPPTKGPPGVLCGPPWAMVANIPARTFTWRFLTMIWDWLTGVRRHLAAACAVLLVTAGVCQAGDNEAELRALLEQQQKQIQELKKQTEA